MPWRCQRCKSRERWVTAKNALKLAPQSNLLIKDDGHGALCDFGSAHELDEMFQEIVTVTAQRCTVRWASPERLDSNDPPTPSSDVWSWGWLTWEVRLSHELDDLLFKMG